MSSHAADSGASAPRISYKQYRETQQKFVYWLVNTANNILTVNSRPDAHCTNGVDSTSGPDTTIPGLAADSSGTPPGAPTALNTTGNVTVSGILSLSKLVGQQQTSFPSAIRRLLGSVIQARTSAYEWYLRLEQGNPDANLHSSNVGHKHMLTVLQSSYEALSGCAYAPSPEHVPEPEGLDHDKAGNDEEEWLQLFNRFQGLSVQHGEDGVGDEQDQDDGTASPAPSRAPQRKRKGGKNSAKARKAASRKAVPPPAPVNPLANIPLESYRIIEDEDGIVTDYLIAVHDIAQEWVNLRLYLQDLWHEVAYGGLNTAVAGALSNMAVAAVRQRALDISIDFPEHDAFDTVVQTITRGDIERARDSVTFQLWSMGPDGEHGMVVETHPDVEELLMLHTYRDLVDFAVDFQQNRTGKPTKRMQKQLGTWDPKLNLQRATPEQRLTWRRAFTINWLYDLVNLFSPIVVQRNTQRGEGHLYEHVDWSPDGPWDEHRRLFGLNAFAGFVTSIAMQKPGTNIRSRILPHHVFQLQGIVDSLAVSRGWSIGLLKGNVVGPAATAFRPRRDVDLFLDRNNQRLGHGYLQGIDFLKALLDHEQQQQRRFRYDELALLAMENVKLDFIDWLGETKYMHGLNDIPPSRFSSTDSNGLWEYSPYMCGTGLAEGLELASKVGQLLWDSMPEALLAVHIHNMLVQQGYLSRPVGLFATVQGLYPTAYFEDGKVPTSDFLGALLARTKADSPKLLRAQLQHRRRVAKTLDWHKILHPGQNKFFNNPTTLVACHDADWVVEHIPDTAIEPMSMIGQVRLARTKRDIDPETGAVRFADTDLVCRARARGMDDAEILDMSSAIDKLTDHGRDFVPPAGMVPDGYTTHKSLEQLTGAISSRDMLAFARLDVEVDVCGARPTSALNHATAMVSILMLWSKIEDQLKEARTPAYCRTFESGIVPGARRISLVADALHGGDPQTLEIMAATFELNRCGFLDFCYWDDINDDYSAAASSLARTSRTEDPTDSQCVVM